ncbi:hypothetical protein R3P38DRAFT_2815921 [Favolaschia claudopus]|uniref:Uncharacterized protein n=1 Tax=Favolaschia claudopus TaxID=2862362 RepID=A0AAV9Z0C3_9AGAR
MTRAPSAISTLLLQPISVLFRKFTAIRLGQPTLPSRCAGFSGLGPSFNTSRFQAGPNCIPGIHNANKSTPFLCMSILARGFPLMATDNESTSKFGQPALENGIIKQGFLSANLLAELEVDVSNNGIIFDIKFGDSIPQAVPPSSNITSTVLGSRNAETLATVVGGSSFAATTTIVQSSVAPSIPSASFRASAVQTSFHSPTSSHSGTGSVSQPESFSASTSIAASASRAMFSSLPSSGLSQTSSAVSPSSCTSETTSSAQHQINSQSPTFADI